MAAVLVADHADAAALEVIGIDLEQVRRRAEESFGPGALDRREPTITDGHVLLALLARDQAPAARLLRRLGVEPADVRERLEEAMAPSGRPHG